MQPSSMHPHLFTLGDAPAGEQRQASVINWRFEGMITNGSSTATTVPPHGLEPHSWPKTWTALLPGNPHVSLSSGPQAECTEPFHCVGSYALPRRVRGESKVTHARFLILLQLILFLVCGGASSFCCITGMKDMTSNWIANYLMDQMRT